MRGSLFFCVKCLAIEHDEHEAKLIIIKNKSLNRGHLCQSGFKGQFSLAPALIPVLEIGPKVDSGGQGEFIYMLPLSSNLMAYALGSLSISKEKNHTKAKKDRLVELKVVLKVLKHGPGFTQYFMVSDDISIEGKGLSVSVH